MKYWAAGIIVSLFALTQIGCEALVANKKRTPLEEQGIRDLPVPSEFELQPPKPRRSSRDAASLNTGVLVYKGPAALDEVIRFYDSSLILDGWEKLERSPVEFPASEPLDRSIVSYFAKERSAIQVKIGESTKSRPGAPESIVIVQIQNR